MNIIKYKYVKYYNAKELNCLSTTIILLVYKLLILKV
jgi:hypothetical protein